MTMLRRISLTLAALALAVAAACAKTDDAPPLALEVDHLADSATTPYQGEIEWCDLVIGELTTAVPYHFHSFTGACGDVFIDLANRDEEDTFLLVYENRGSGWTLSAFDDDCYPGTLNSCVELETEAGVEYLVGATSYEYLYWGRRTAMEYHLRVSCRDDAGECFDPTVDPEIPCGSRGLAPCADGYYCDWEDAGCGADDRPGLCQPLPDSCPRVHMPVCGCDGVTYTNECYAAMMGGVDVAHDGYCPGPRGEGEPCGGFAGFMCDASAGLVCDYSHLDFSATGVCGADYMGVCVVDEEVFCPFVWAPVCGCDGRTYGNDCERRAAHVALRHMGECAR